MWFRIYKTSVVKFSRIQIPSINNAVVMHTAFFCCLPQIITTLRAKANISKS